MNAGFTLDRTRHMLCDAHGRAFDPATRRWGDAATVAAVASPAVGAIEAATWLQRDSGHPLRVPIGVIGPRQASPAQLEAAVRVGIGLAAMGLPVVCGGRGGVMRAVCEGVQQAGGLSLGLLPDASPELANPFVSIALATGIGEARNALIARAALCLVAIGDSYGTLSEVALGLQFGKTVIGLEGAARVDGVRSVATADEALDAVARVVLGS
jgi:uncharacterized protein (TIGR00725 family)